MSKPPRWTRVAATALGALLFGILGANLGSWVAGRHPGPLPDTTEAIRLTQEILPNPIATDGIDRRDYLYGSPLDDDEYGPGYVHIPYDLGDDPGESAQADCGPDRLARDNAARHGWADPQELTGYRCSSWQVQRGDLVLAYTHEGAGLAVTFYRSTTSSTIGALIGALFGALAGVAAFRPLSRRRPLILLTALIPPALILVPVTLIWIVAVVQGGEGPAFQLWSVWPGLAQLYFYP